jgi:Transglycosylase SLT domain
MSATLTSRFEVLRRIHSLLHYLHLDLMLAGLFIGITLTNLVANRVELLASINSALPTLSSSASIDEGSELPDTRPRTILTPAMASALESISRRYRVSTEALFPVFEAAQIAGRERNIDPLLLIAIISVESSFNPYSQSVVGAQGLMQVIPRFHQDKIPEWAGNQPFLDPVSNVYIGTHVLQEAISRQGDLMLGLQYYAGALSDEDLGYANKVLAEKLRLSQAPRRAS